MTEGFLIVRRDNDTTRDIALFTNHTAQDTTLWVKSAPLVYAKLISGIIIHYCNKRGPLQDILQRIKISYDGSFAHTPSVAGLVICSHPNAYLPCCNKWQEHMRKAVLANCATLTITQEAMWQLTDPFNTAGTQTTVIDPFKIMVDYIVKLVRNKK